MTTRPALQEMPKLVLQGEMKTLDSNFRLYGEIKTCIKVNTRTVIKASIVVRMVCNSTFFSYMINRPMHLKGKKYIIK